MRLRPRTFVAAAMLTAMAGMTGITSAGTASASTASAIASTERSAAQPDSAAVTCVTGASAVWIQNIGSGTGTYVGPPGIGGQYDQVTTSAGASLFCPAYEATFGGVKYYFYINYNTGKCLTANANTEALYEATCGLYPASQDWHYYELSKGNTLENYYTSSCVWFLKPFDAGDLINIGGCTVNENNDIEQVSD